MKLVRRKWFESAAALSPLQLFRKALVELLRRIGERQTEAAISLVLAKPQ